MWKNTKLYNELYSQTENMTRAGKKFFKKEGNSLTFVVIFDKLIKEEGLFQRKYFFCFLG